MRKNYWSCSKFADWLRGTPKGGAKTSEGWDDWRKEAETKYPFRYWLAEEGLDKIQNFIHYIPDKLYAAKYYINNRFITRSHGLTAHPRDIKPGTWRDLGDRFLPCMFNELVEFVEVELAWWHLAWSPEERAKYNMPWWAVGWWRIRSWRCPAAGLDNLEWQRNLRWKEDECEPGSPNVGQLTPQAVNAQEILDLYTWWTQTYRNRPDPYDVSGWTAYCAQDRSFSRIFSEKGPEEKKDVSNMLDTVRNLEEQYENEDTEMLTRLIKVRRALWT